MNIKIQSNGLVLAPTISKLVHQRIKKLTRLYNEIIASEITFRVENDSTNENNVCEMRLVVPGYDFIASNKSNTFEEAVSKTSEALERQIEKRKTKLKRASLRFSS
ncbi:ribosome-associated translation inhibitor RaiA [Lutibacter sp.]|uniref:ribosome hibernation-promoting factor, HPF/YfiA family n=1 Tax=Lutibacter sp. TaxID=1925666 RepID=UPI001A238559|nr:ribosome-associated translation inhibitor RaiA [Lutibacter sp.]MBI9041932.1 ribosome-associated translation inhibitor RaiA [Lutibacter sp.]